MGVTDVCSRKGRQGPLPGHHEVNSFAHVVMFCLATGPKAEETATPVLKPLRVRQERLLPFQSRWPQHSVLDGRCLVQEVKVTQSRAQHLVCPSPPTQPPPPSWPLQASPTKTLLIGQKSPIGGGGTWREKKVSYSFRSLWLTIPTPEAGYGFF